MIHIPTPKPVTRREALCRMGAGFGMLSFASLIADTFAQAAESPAPSPWMIQDPKFKPKAKHSISSPIITRSPVCAIRKRSVKTVVASRWIFWRAASIPTAPRCFDTRTSHKSQNWPGSCRPWRRWACWSAPTLTKTSSPADCPPPSACSVTRCLWRRTF